MLTRIRDAAAMAAAWCLYQYGRYITSRRFLRHVTPDMVAEMRPEQRAAYHRLCRYAALTPADAYAAYTAAE